MTLDRDQAVRDTLAQLSPARLQRRIKATAEAHRLLSDRLGRLDEAALRRVLELFNQDVSRDREVQGRFATGLVVWTGGTALIFGLIAGTYNRLLALGQNDR